MKANELMIGDWVGRVFDDRRIIGDCRQVDWIRTGEIGMRYQKVWSIGCIEPIPLTEEILKKNGWKYDAYDISWYHNDVLFDVDLCACSIMFFEYKLCDANYVHELQHALRLCGLKELADNFKI